ncbi:MAG TPA: sensor domain-containing diguanylate cyclase [Steroidobacteraceae bacterium]|nr:sensor domain-containing diguanylate cyclase [Steroidobacteraceae bacterium]
MTKALPAPILTHLLEESLDAVLIIDATCRIRYVNAAMEKLCGFGAGELLGESMNGLLPPEIAAEHDSYVQRYLESLRPSTVLGKVRELQLRHRTGEIIPVELKAVDMGIDGGVRFFGAFMSDLRERKEIETKNKALVAQLEQQALTDSLTGLPNRRAFQLEATRVMANSKREAWPVSVGIADIDWFKHVNDKHGHAVGDCVLRNVAQLIQKTIRAGDLCGRIGGEEFGLLLPHATVEQAAVIAERVRTTLADQSVPGPNDLRFAITISIGLAKWNSHEPLEVALAQADSALYQAKLSGRNRLIVAHGP